MQSPVELLRRYGPKGVLIDSNILLLHVVGSCDRRQIGEFKLTRNYTAEDFETLLTFLRHFKHVVTTQCILTEVSNHLGFLSSQRRKEFFESYSKQIQVLAEPCTPSAELAAEPSFPRFGLTDTSVMHEAKNRFLVLTDDLPLFQYLNRLDVDALNFNYLRMMSWQVV